MRAWPDVCFFPQFRYTLLSLAGLEAPLQLEIEGSTYGDDCIFIANDWHASMVPVYLAAKYRPGGVYRSARSVLAIHNLRHQVRAHARTCRQLQQSPPLLCSPHKLRHHATAQHSPSSCHQPPHAAHLQQLQQPHHCAAHLQQLQPSPRCAAHAAHVCGVAGAAQGVFPPTSYAGYGLPGEWYGALEWQYPPHQRQGSYEEEGRAVNTLKARTAHSVQSLAFFLSGRCSA